MLYQKGSAAYEQFEGSYLFICASFLRDPHARPEVIQEFTAPQEEPPEEEEEYVLRRAPHIRTYPRPRWNETEFAGVAQRFIDEHLELFADRGYLVRVLPNSVAVGLAAVVFCIGGAIFACRA